MYLPLYGYRYLIYILPGLILAFYAQAKIRKAYSKYSQIDSGTYYTGKDVARMIMDRNNLSHVPIERISGTLTDHYDPRGPILRLSNGVYNSSSVAALSIAAHEVGHAMQDESNYQPMRLRQILVPATNIGSRFAYLFILLGLFLGASFVKIGVALFALAVLFQLVTLPVELNASKRAKMALASGILDEQHLDGADEVLNAAAMTYVASLVTAIGSFMRLLAIFGMGRRRD